MKRPHHGPKVISVPRAATVPTARKPFWLNTLQPPDPAGGFRSVVLERMVPGTPIGVLLGDLVYAFLARRLGRRTGRDDVTAMPLGLNAPSVFGMSFAVLGSIGGAGIALIGLLPLLKVFADPIVGFVGLGVILITLFGGVRLPGGLPGAFVSVVAAVAVSWALSAAGLHSPLLAPVVHVTALIWGAATADLIERRFFRSALAFFAAALLCLFGVIHSSTPTGTLFLPWRAGSHVPYHFAAAYAVLDVIVLLAGRSQEEDRAGVR